LEPALQFGASMSSGRVHALILTVPSATEETTVHYESGRDASVVSRPMADGMEVTLRNLAEMEYLVVYDAAASTISVNGQALTKLDGGPGMATPGWQVDPGMNRLLIRLPSGPAKTVEQIRLNLKPSSANK